MKKKAACVIKVLIIVAVLAAAVAAILFYKNELLDALDMAREKLDSLKRRYLCRREFEDYEDDIL
ncbi:MAG: hypothetical protein MJ075_00790 [Oscillospiraceae bacterium]|nr:hypothetical protein [Oscillospiraceae bacterium]